MHKSRRPGYDFSVLNDFFAVLPEHLVLRRYSSKVRTPSTLRFRRALTAYVPATAKSKSMYRRCRPTTLGYCLAVLCVALFLLTILLRNSRIPSTMPPAKFPCDGCDRRFTHSGLNSHLRQTRNLPCAALYAQQHAYVPAADEAIDLPPLSPNPRLHSSPPPQSN